MQVHPKGGISYIASGFSNQYGVETQIISAICAYILLLSLVPSLVRSVAVPSAEKWDKYLN